MADEQTTQDYYAILEVSPGADEETIRQAYRRLAWRYHPDIAGTQGDEQMRALNVAYQTLSDPDRRRAYNANHNLPTLSDASAHVPQRATATSSAPRVGFRTVSAGRLKLLHRLEGPVATPVAACAFAREAGVVGVGMIDGQIGLWSLPDAQPLTQLHFGSQTRRSSAGVLHELRLSPRGALAAAWGFLLGARVWSTTDGRALWSTGINAPTGLMDAILFDDPPLIRLATPDAPLALADDDPFRWASQGQRSSAVYARPLAGPISAAWANPYHCDESVSEGFLREAPDMSRRIHQRILSADGRYLLTFSTGERPRLGRSNILTLWEMDRRTLLGAVEPKRSLMLSEPAGGWHFPLTATPDLSWIAIGAHNRQMVLFATRSRQGRPLEVGILPHDARAALSPDGEWLALAHDNRLDVYETRTNRGDQEWTFGDEITALVWSPNPRRALLAVGLRNGLTELWG